MDATILTMEQGTPEWFAARAGRLSASDAAAAISGPKKGGEETVGRRDLRLQLVAERLTGKPVEMEGFESAWMRRGKELQPQALAAYETVTGALVQTCGYVAHNRRATGCSPDGLIDLGKGGVELKCGKLVTHLSWLRAGRVPPEHVAQMLHSLWVCEDAAFWDFVSYAPDLPENLQLFIVRMERDEAAIATYEQKALQFLRECDVELQALQTLANLRGQLKAAVAVT